MLVTCVTIFILILGSLWKFTVLDSCDKLCCCCSLKWYDFCHQVLKELPESKIKRDVDLDSLLKVPSKRLAECAQQSDERFRFMMPDIEFQPKKHKKNTKNHNNNSKIMKFDWNQTNSEVIVNLYVSHEIDPSSAKFTSTDDTCTVVFNDGRVWKCEFYAKVISEGSTMQYKGNRMILKFVKKSFCENWPQLEACDNKDVDQMKNEYNQVVELSNVHHNHYEKSTNDTVCVYVYVKNIDKETLNINFCEKSITLKFKTSDSKFLNDQKNCSANTFFIWKLNLKHKIIPKISSFKLSPVRLEMTLRKTEPLRWGALLEIENVADTSLPEKKFVPVSSTSPKTEKMASEKVNIELPKNNEAFSKTPSYKKPTCMVLPINKSKTCEEIVSRGMTGLDNLGNTCFVNSVIQCLANTREFRDYFMNAQFQSDINCDNPLGMGGKLALSFAVLLRVLWSGTHYSYAPSKLKNLISMKASQFTGFAQHDAQEFMAFLLDGLHEDLNRVKKKPYVESIECDGKNVNEIAKESWMQYRLRNDSVVVDLFQGQYKSKLVCPMCDKVSITFDPFLYLSVPVPKKQMHISIVFFWRNPLKKPIKLQFSFPHGSLIEDLKQKLYETTNVKPHCQRIIEVYKGKIHKFFSNGSQLSVINFHDIIYGFEKLDERLTSEQVLELGVIQRTVIPKPGIRCSFCKKECLPSSTERLKRCTKCYHVSYCNQTCQKNHWSVHKGNCKATPELVGQPFIISILESQATYSKLYNLLETYSRHTVDVFLPPTSKKSSLPENVSSPCDQKENDLKSSHTLNDEDSNKHSSPSSDDKYSACDKFDKQVENQINNEFQEDPERASINLSCSSLSSEETETSTGLVCGVSKNTTNSNSFFIRSVDKYGVNTQSEPFSDEGDSTINLKSTYFLSMDWKNNPKYDNYVLIQSKNIDCEESSSEPENKEISVDDCLNLFTEPEKLSPQEAWYCSQCKKHQEATKEMALWRLPTVLIIQLKRFSFKNLIWRDKIDKMVNFPIRGLDIAPYYCGPTSADSTIYDLYAVINHHGGILGGHYTSYARCTDLNNTRKSEVGWRLFDDSRVSQCSDENVVTKSAYVLFYRRRGVAFNSQFPSINLSVDSNVTKKSDSDVELDSDDEIVSCTKDTSNIQLDSNIVSEERDKLRLNCTNMDAVD